MDGPLTEDWPPGGQAYLGRADRRFAIPRADGWRQRDCAQLWLLQPGRAVGCGEPRGVAGRGRGHGTEERGRGPRSATGARGGHDAPTFGENSAAHAEASRVPKLPA